MTILESEAYDRLSRAARAVDPSLAVDRASIRWVEAPYPGVAYGLVLQGSHALLFIPAADIAGPEWERLLPSRLESARSYLLGFQRRTR
jgi:hypothetical protein